MDAAIVSSLPSLLFGFRIMDEMLLLYCATEIVEFREIDDRSWPRFGVKGD
jgi:hypothetical protein